MIYRSFSFPMDTVSATGQFRFIFQISNMEHKAKPRAMLMRSPWALILLNGYVTIMTGGVV